MSADIEYCENCGKDTFNVFKKGKSFPVFCIVCGQLRGEKMSKRTIEIEDNLQEIEKVAKKIRDNFIDYLKEILI